jgi:hypothetical protein
MFREANDVTTIGSTPTRNAGGYYNAAGEPQKEEKEMSGMTTKDEHGNTVTKYAAHINHDAELHNRVHDLEHEVTDAVANLGELLARLRRLRLYALDGDDAAAANALKALGLCRNEDCDCGIDPILNEEVSDHLSVALDKLEALVNGRTEQFERNVPGDQIEGTVQELLGPALVERYDVEVIEHPFWGKLPPHAGRIIYSRHGRWVVIRVERIPDHDAEAAAAREAMEALIRERGLEGSYEAAYQAVVAAEGAAAARAIRSAVESVAKGDPEKQIELLRAAVAV